MTFSSAEYEDALLENLRRAVHGLSAPFNCGGTLVPQRPVTIAFPDKTQIAVRRAKDPFEQERLVQPLIERCTVAPFGMGRKTRYDRTVRDALQIKAEGGAFSVLHFDPASAGILEQIRRELMPNVPINGLTADLYALNVYKSEGHFVPHKDTPRGTDMVGTLVVCLPAQFRGGEFVVNHRGVFHTYDWAEAIREQAEPTRIHWAAFFGDVDHSIDKVYGGARVTLTYLLGRTSTTGRSVLPGRRRETLDTLVRQKLRAVLDDRRFMTRGGTLAFPCSHLYHQHTRFQREPRPLSRQTLSLLKGRDYIVAAAAMSEGLEVSLCPYMVETSCDETWQLEHFPTSRERAALDEQVDPDNLEAALPVLASSDDDFGVVWVEPPPQFNEGPTMYAETRDGHARAVDPDLPALMHLHSCEYSATGYFGNEGSDVEFYVYCALHVAIPAYGKGTRAVTTTTRSARRGRTKRG